MVLTNARIESDVLDQVTVRLVREDERGQFNYCLEEKHYLKSSILVGEWLRYVAEVDGQWVGLLAFSAPALHLKARERWIGWSPRQRARRLGLVANNSRFLVLAQRQRYPNLASRVLGMTLRRLSADWQERWGHPVLAVESFVDESQYRGTCYRACGFQAIGATEGFGRASRDFYEAHGQPKQLYVRELRSGACKKLRQARLPEELELYEADLAGPCPFRAPALESLLAGFGSLPDSRYGHGLRHRQRFVLACAAVCTLMGVCGFRGFENTCQKFTRRQLRALGCKPHEQDGGYYPPSDSTFQRVLNKVDAISFASIIGTWLAEQEIGASTKLVPGNPQMEYNYGLALVEQKKFAPALAIMQKVAAIDPKMPGAWYYIGLLNETQAKYPEAISKSSNCSRAPASAVSTARRLSTIAGSVAGPPSRTSSTSTCRKSAGHGASSSCRSLVMRTACGCFPVVVFTSSAPLTN